MFEEVLQVPRNFGLVPPEHHIPARKSPDLLPGLPVDGFLQQVQPEPAARHGSGLHGVLLLLRQPIDPSHQQSVQGIRYLRFPLFLTQQFKSFIRFTELTFLQQIPDQLLDEVGVSRGLFLQEPGQGLGNWSAQDLFGNPATGLPREFGQFHLLKSLGHLPLGAQTGHHRQVRGIFVFGLK